MHWGQHHPHSLLTATAPWPLQHELNCLQKGEGGMSANFAHLGLRAAAATHTHTCFPSVLPRSRGLCSWCKTLLHVCTYNTQLQGLLHPDPSTAALEHFWAKTEMDYKGTFPLVLQWMMFGEWWLQNAPLVQTTLILCGCFLWILVNILNQNQGLIINPELSDATVSSTMAKGHVWEHHLQLYKYCVQNQWCGTKAGEWQREERRKY